MIVKSHGHFICAGVRISKPCLPVLWLLLFCNPFQAPFFAIYLLFGFNDHGSTHHFQNALLFIPVAFQLVLKVLPFEYLPCKFIALIHNSRESVASHLLTVKTEINFS